MLTCGTFATLATYNLNGECQPEINRIRPVWSESSLDAHAILLGLSWGGSIISLTYPGFYKDIWNENLTTLERQMLNL